MLQIAVIPLLLAAQDVSELRYMQHAAYYAGSFVEDPLAAGGFGTSDNYPVQLAIPGSKRLAVQVSPSPKGVTVKIANGGRKAAWLRAGDSNILGWLEAKDRQGEWRPIQWHYRYTCGNSYHRVQAPPGQGWIFSVPLPKGDFSTAVRWRYRSGDSSLTSNEIRLSIPLQRFLLEPAVAKKSVVKFMSGFPMLWWTGDQAAEASAT